MTTEKTENDDPDEKAAHAYRLRQAEGLLRSLGYSQIPNSRFWKKENLDEQEKKFYLLSKRLCPIGEQPHDFQIASSFLNESEIFEIQAQPQDTICRKCLGFLEDFMENDSDE